MSTPVPVGCDRSFDLPTINTIVAQNEGVLGPLIAIGNDGAQTVLTFDTDPPAPATNAVLTKDKNGQPDVPANATQVCRGAVFVAGQLVDCTASRTG